MIQVKVLFLTNIPSPYRVDFFNELGRYCDLTVVFERYKSSERNDLWEHSGFNNFKGIILRGMHISVDMSLSLDALRYIHRDEYDIVVSTTFLTPTGFLLTRKMKYMGIPYCIEADGGIQGSGKGIKEYIKKIAISGATTYFSTSKMCDNYFLAYGADSNEIVRYPFTSLSITDIIPSPLSKQDKVELRERLGIKEKNVIITVGRFSYLNGYGKGFDTFVEVSRRFSEDFGFYIIGDEPTAEFLLYKEQNNLHNLHFLPFMKKAELYQYYQAADLSMLLSKKEAWGLVINESMSNGVPVIATKTCVGSSELIIDKENGFIVNVGDVELIEDDINLFFSMEKHEQDLMCNNCLRKIKLFTIQEMANVHMKVFNNLINR